MHLYRIRGYRDVLLFHMENKVHDVITVTVLCPYNTGAKFWMNVSDENMNNLQSDRTLVCCSVPARPSLEVNKKYLRRVNRKTFKY